MAGGRGGRGGGGGRGRNERMGWRGKDMGIKQGSVEGGGQSEERRKVGMGVEGGSKRQRVVMFEAGEMSQNTGVYVHPTCDKWW